MSKFVRNLTIEREYEGDKVVFVVTPMSYAAALRFRDMARSGADDKREQGESLLLSEFREAVQSVAGLVDAAGVAVDKDTVFTAAYFAPLLASAAIEWMQSSTPSGKDSRQPESSSDDSLPVAH